MIQQLVLVITAGVDRVMEQDVHHAALMDGEQYLVLTRRQIFGESRAFSALCAFHVYHALTSTTRAMIDMTVGAVYVHSSSNHGGIAKHSSTLFLFETSRTIRT